MEIIKKVRRNRRNNKKLRQIIVLIVIAMLCSFPVIIAETIYYNDIDIYPCPMNFSINEDINTTFGSIQTGKSKILTSSFVINNTINSCNISVSANFTTNVDGTYGFISNSEVISANNFRLNGTSLSSTGEVVYIDSVAIGTSKNYDAELSVPVAQEPAIYNGEIELVIEQTT